MKAEEIKDEASLRGWLAQRPLPQAQKIAIRSALRVFPIFASAMDEPWARKLDLTSFEVLPGLFGKLPFTPTRISVGGDYFETARAPVLAAVSASAAVDPENSVHRILLARTPGDLADPYVSLTVSIRAARDAADEISPLAAYALWEEVSADTRMLEEGKDPTQAPLWSTLHPDWFTDHDRKTREIWSRDPDTWSFWTRWWDGILSGRQIDRDLQHQVALIPDALWQEGPAAVAEAIREIERKRDPVDSDLRDLPAAPATQVQAVRAAMERNRQSLPPTFDAIEGLLLLEIERLQRSNDRDEEWSRQLRLFLSLHEAITRLRASLPLDGPVSTAQAETSERLVRLYARKFAELPRARVDDVVEGVVDTAKGVVQVGLIGTTALLGMAYGLPALAGAAIGSMVFARKNAADLIKSLGELLPKPGP